MMLSRRVVVILRTIVTIGIIEWAHGIRGIVERCATRIGGIVLCPARCLRLMLRFMIRSMREIIWLLAAINWSIFPVDFYPPQLPHNRNDRCQRYQEQQNTFVKKDEQQDKAGYHRDDFDALISWARCFIGIFSFSGVIHGFYLANSTVFVFPVLQALVLLRRSAISFCHSASDSSRFTAKMPEFSPLLDEVASLLFTQRSSGGCYESSTW